MSDALMKAACALVAALAITGCGCRKEETPPEQPVKAEKPAHLKGSTPEQRMKDPEYLKRIDERIEGQKPLMRAVGEARAKLDALKAAEPKDPAAIAAAEAELKKAADELLAYRKASERMVARQMRTEYDENGKPVKNGFKEQKKGN